MPYQLAKQHGILIIGEPLGDFHGYYNNIDNCKIIHVNTRVPNLFRKYVVAFLVYGAINKPAQILCLKKSDQTYSKHELEAAVFALRLLTNDLLSDFAKSCKSDQEQIKDLLSRVTNRVSVQDVFRLS